MKAKKPIVTITWKMGDSICPSPDTMVRTATLEMPPRFIGDKPKEIELAAIHDFAIFTHDLGILHYTVLSSVVSTGEE